MIDVGRGSPVVLIPGIQGRWEWMRSTVAALSRHARVITFSLADEPSSAAEFDPASGFASYVQQVAAALDRAGLERATICGVSYGGLIAAAFAARYPERVSALVLVSAVPPSWQPDSRARFYLSAPRLLFPLFCVASIRLLPEFVTAAGGRLGGLAAAARHGVNAITHLSSPVRMARRVKLLEGFAIDAVGTKMNAPVLVVTGENALDLVVPVDSTHEYLKIWPHARAATLPRTGHLGVITTPEAFARTVAGFLDEARVAEERRRIG